MQLSLIGYGNILGRRGESLITYFPECRRPRMRNQSLHYDPEFDTFTYGDPTSPKAGLRRLERGDLLIFYCGLQGWDFESAPALYLMGYFEVEAAGRASDFEPADLARWFANNFHVKHRDVYTAQRDRLVLVKGSSNSRLLKTAVRISEMGSDCSGKPLKVLSPRMQKIFGEFEGKLSFQRSPTRWVDKTHLECAVDFVTSLMIISVSPVSSTPKIRGRAARPLGECRTIISLPSKAVTSVLSLPTYSACSSRIRRNSVTRGGRSSCRIVHRMSRSTAS